MTREYGKKNCTILLDEVIKVLSINKRQKQMYLNTLQILQTYSTTVVKEHVY